MLAVRLIFALRLVETGGGFVELDQDFGRVGGGNEKEVYAGAVRAGACRGVDRRHVKFTFENLRGAVHVLALIFDLLDTFAEFLQELCDSAAPRRIFARQHIHRKSTREVQFEFEGVLVGWHFRESGQPARFMDLFKSLSGHGKPDGHLGVISIEQCREFFVAPPGVRGVVGERPADFVNLSGGNGSNLRFRRGHAIDRALQ